MLYKNSIVINTTILFLCTSFSLLIPTNNAIINEFNKFSIPLFVTLLAIFITISVTLFSQLLGIKRKYEDLLPEDKKDLLNGRNPFDETTKEIKRVFYIQILLLALCLILTPIVSIFLQPPIQCNIDLMNQIQTIANIFTLTYYIRALIDVFNASLDILSF